MTLPTSKSRQLDNSEGFPQRDRMIPARFASLPVVTLCLAGSALASEQTPRPESGSRPPSDEPAPFKNFAPPRVDYPGSLQIGRGLVVSLDHTYQATDDLSTFWWVKGRGENYRLALGASYQTGGLQVDAEIPVQYTRLEIDSMMGLPPTEPDRKKAGGSLGDLITSGSHQWSLPTRAPQAQVGLGLRVRWPTHTTRFGFGLVDGSILEFNFPYYLHLAPALLLSATHGSFSVVVHQGMLGMLAKDVTIGDVLQRIPNLYFWESHLAAGFRAFDFLVLSIELTSFVQLNRVDVDMMTNLNHIRAVFLNPGVTFEHGNYRLALAGRIGIGGRSSRDFGVITFSGAHAFLARLGYVF